MVLSALCESFTISSLIPFILILTNPENINNYKIFRYFRELLNISNSNEFLFLVVIIFCFAILLSGFIRILNLALSNKLAALIGNDLSYECYKKTLYQSYLKHINQNTSKIISMITDYINGTVTSINAYLQMMTSLIIVI